MPNIAHSDFVTSIALSPDGTRVISGSHDRTIKLWDAATGQLLRTLMGHEGHVLRVAFSPEGARVASGGEDWTLRLWDVTTGELLRTIYAHSSRVWSVAFSPNGVRVASGGDDKIVRLWEITTGELLRTFEGHDRSISSITFSPDGLRLLSNSGGRLRLWDVETGQLIRSFGEASGSVAFSPDGGHILSGDEADQDRGAGRGQLTLWDAATGQLLRTFSGHRYGVTSVAFSPDGAQLLSGSLDYTLKLWDAKGGRLIRTFEGHSEKVESVAFSPDGTRVLSGSADNTLRLWDAASGQLLRTFVGHSDRIESVTFLADGKRVLSRSLDKTLRLWDVATGELVRTLGEHTGRVHSVAFSPDAVHVLSGSSDKTLRLWDMTTGQLVRTFAGHSDGITSVAFSPDGTRVLSGSDDKKLKLWDVTTGQVLRTFQDDTVSSVKFSPDGAHAVSSSGGSWRLGWRTTLKLWDIATGRQLHRFKGHDFGPTSVAFSPDGARLLSGSWEGTLNLWDAATGQLIRTFAGRSTTSVAFSPDGTRVLSGGADSTLRLWDAASGQLVQTFAGHSDGITSVAFSPDGTRVLSGSEDSTLRLWDAASGQLLRTFKGHTGKVVSVSFSPDSTRLVSGGWDTSVRIWTVATSEALASLFSSRDGQWLAITRAGFFAASHKGTDILAVVRGLEATTIDQVHQSLFNPDLVRETLAGDPGGEAQEAAKVVNLEKVLDSGPAPTVAVVSHPDGSQSTTDLVTVAARIQDKGKGNGRIEWRVNGITAAVDVQAPGGGPAYIVTKQLALDPGENIVEVVAYNGTNLLASLPARTIIKFTGSADRTKPKLHILAIGINAYVDRGSPLRFGPLGLAVKDATAFGAAMKKAAGSLYNEVRVTLALDRDATRDNLEKTVAKIAREIHPRDSFILFAAGHGTSDNGRFYFIPQDYQSGPGNLARRAIGQDRLQDWLANRIKAKRAIILLDTCESGALVAGHARSRADAPASEAAVGRLHEATGRPVLTAAAAGQFAHEGLIGVTGQRHGVFTWAVLDALQKGDSNGNGLIELSELVRHVQSVVPAIAAKLGGKGRAATAEPVFGKQAARFGSRGEDFWLVKRLP